MFLFLLLRRAFITKPLWIWRLLPVSRSLCLSTTPSSLFLSVFHFLSSMERGERKYQQNWEDGWQVASFGENRSVRGCVSRCISIYAWTNLASDAKKKTKKALEVCLHEQFSFSDSLSDPIVPNGRLLWSIITILRFAFRSDRSKWLAFMKHYNHDYHTSLLAIQAWERTAIPDCFYIRVTLYWGYTRAATLNCHKRFISSLYFSWLEELLS